MADSNTNTILFSSRTSLFDNIDKKNNEQKWFTYIVCNLFIILEFPRNKQIFFKIYKNEFKKNYSLNWNVTSDIDYFPHN